MEEEEEDLRDFEDAADGPSRWEEEEPLEEEGAEAAGGTYEVCVVCVSQSMYVAVQGGDAEAHHHLTREWHNKRRRQVEATRELREAYEARTEARAQRRRANLAYREFAVEVSRGGDGDSDGDGSGSDASEYHPPSESEGGSNEDAHASELESEGYSDSAVESD